MKKFVCILDYGSGNVRSVFNIFKKLLDDVLISNKQEDIKKSTHLILPGVGAFGASMEKIQKLIPLKIVEDCVFVDRKPFLGICVGMQVLADIGYEFGEHKGLGWISGNVRKLEAGQLPLPHIGWNDIKVLKSSPIAEGLKQNDFYFIHSFVFEAKDKENIIGVANYGEEFVAIVSKDNIYGVQFHPEKSQKSGMRLLNNFLSI